jgi:hypothetical protein
MATTAFQTLYRDEWIAAFERDKSTLRETTTRESMIRGRQAVFLVASSGSEAVTRGGNGLIPSTPLSLTQNTVTLAEAHSLKQMTGFNLFAGQSNQREIMQNMTRVEINRHVDDIIIDILTTGTVEPTATAGIMTKQLVTEATTLLWNGNVPNDGQVFGLLTPAAWGHLSDIPEFANSQFVGATPLVEGAPTMGKPMKNWLGVNWMMHTGLVGVGTATAECYIYHKSAIGYGYASGEIMASAGYDDEQDYSWARATVYDGALKLQNSGIVVINHDDSQYS